jgi:hypothetical protein
MGVVYRAEHRVMGRVVALKVLSTGVTANPTAVDRFRREVRLASRLNHPHIVTAYDADEAGGLHFLVMEFVEGASLAQVVWDRGPLPVAMACECARQAALGLQHAHDRGMIHRDIKPHNLMLTKTGQVKILDFGLARVASAEGVDPASVTAQALTQPQTLVGTPDFLSPEQARSIALDGRSDLYSLGCTLYFLLTGNPPYGGAGAYAKMIAHFKDPIPDLTAARPDVPPQLAALFDKLMAKLPEDRYQTAAEVAAALLPFAGAIDGAGTGAPAEPCGAHDRALTTFEDTLPSCAKDGVTSALPLASECEPSVAPMRPVRPVRATPKPTGPVKSRRGTFALAALVLVGLGIAGAAVYLNRGKDAPADHQTAGADPGPEPAPPTPPAPAPSPKPAPGVVPGPTPVEPVGKKPPPVVPARKKHVLLLVPPDFAAGELADVTSTLKQRGVDVLTAGPEKKPLDGYRYGLGTKMHVKTFEPDLGVKEVTDGVLKSIDAAIAMPGDAGAFGPKGSAGADFARIIGKLIQQKKVVGAIAAPGIIELGGHGFLEHAEVSTPTFRTVAVEKLKVKKWTPDPKVVIDLPFITTGEFSHGRSLAEAVVKALADHPH